jgi:hypothetical protein
LASRTDVVSLTRVRGARTLAAGPAVLLSALLLAATAAAGSGFVSDRYRYQFDPGTGFYAQYATSQWHGAFPFGGDPGVDTFIDWHERKFIVAAMPVPASMRPSEWEAKHVARMQSFCKRAHAFRRSTLGGVAAMEFIDACPDYDVIVLTAVRAGRGYIFQFVSPTKNSPAADRRAYEAGRRTFHFTG